MAVGFFIGLRRKCVMRRSSRPATSKTKRALAHLGGVAALPTSEDAPAFADIVASTMIRSDLFLGLSRKNGQLIADSEVSAFVDEVVVPRFPAGTTQVCANGTYNSCTLGIIHEPSRLLTILHPNDSVSRAKIHELAAIYRLLFQQETVLIVMSPTLVFGVAV
jgi:hypothetical protein